MAIVYDAILGIQFIRLQRRNAEAALRLSAFPACASLCTSTNTTDKGGRNFILTFEYGVSCLLYTVELISKLNGYTPCCPIDKAWRQQSSQAEVGYQSSRSAKASEFTHG